METFWWGLVRHPVNAGVLAWFFWRARPVCMSMCPFHGKIQTASYLKNCPISLLSRMAGHTTLQAYGSSSTLLAILKERIIGADKRVPNALHLNESYDLSRGQVLLVQPWIDSNAETLSCATWIRFGTQLQNTGAMMASVYNCWDETILKSLMQNNEVKHACIACVSGIAVCFQCDRYHLSGIVEASRSKRGKRLDLMLVLDVLERIFRFNKLANEDENLLPCLYVERKRLHWYRLHFSCVARTCLTCTIIPLVVFMLYWLWEGLGKWLSKPMARIH